MMKPKHRNVSYLVGAGGGSCRTPLYSSSTQSDHNEQTWVSQKTIHGHLLGVNALSFHRPSRYLISAGKDCTVRLWQGENCLAVVDETADQVTCLHVVDDSVDAVGQTNSAESTGRGRPGMATECHGNQPLYVMGAADSTVTLMRGAERQTQVVRHTDWVTCISGIGTSTCVVGGCDGLIHILDVDSELTSVYACSTSRGSGVYALCMLNANVFAVGADDGSILLQDTRRPPGRSVADDRAIQGHEDIVRAILGGPLDEPYFASCGSDGYVRLWDCRQQRCAVGAAVTPSGSVSCRALERIGDLPVSAALMVGCRDGTVAAVQFQPPTVLSSGTEPLFAPLITLSKPVWSMCHSSDGVLYVGTPNSSIHGWDVSLMSADLAATARVSRPSSSTALRRTSSSLHGSGSDPRTRPTPSPGGASTASSPVGSACTLSPSRIVVEEAHAVVDPTFAPMVRHAAQAQLLTQSCDVFRPAAEPSSTDRQETPTCRNEQVGREAPRLPTSLRFRDAAAAISFCRVENSISVTPKPVFCLAGGCPMMACQLLRNRRHVVAQYVDGTFSVWDVVTRAKLMDLPSDVTSLEDALERVNVDVAVDPWCTVECRWGCICVTVTSDSILRAVQCQWEAQISTPGSPHFRKSGAELNRIARAKWHHVPPLNVGAMAMRRLFQAEAPADGSCDSRDDGASGPNTATVIVWGTVSGVQHPVTHSSTPRLAEVPLTLPSPAAAGTKLVLRNTPVRPESLPLAPRWIIELSQSSYAAADAVVEGPGVAPVMYEIMSCDAELPQLPDCTYTGNRLAQARTICGELLRKLKLSQHLPTLQRAIEMGAVDPKYGDDRELQKQVLADEYIELVAIQGVVGAKSPALGGAAPGAAFGSPNSNSATTTNKSENAAHYSIVEVVDPLASLASLFQRCKDPATRTLRLRYRRTPGFSKMLPLSATE